MNLKNLCTLPLLPTTEGTKRSWRPLLRLKAVPIETLCDLPLITKADYRQLIKHFIKKKLTEIIGSDYLGIIAAPIIIDRKYKLKLKEYLLKNDRAHGAKQF